MQIAINPEVPHGHREQAGVSLSELAVLVIETGATFAEIARIDARGS